MKLPRSSPQQALVCRIRFLFMEWQNTCAESKQTLFSFSFFSQRTEKLFANFPICNTKKGQGKEEKSKQMKQSRSLQCSEPVGLNELTPKPVHSKGGHHWDARDVKYQPRYLLNKVRSRNADSRSVPERQYSEDLLYLLETLTLFTHTANGRDCSHLHYVFPRKLHSSKHCLWHKRTFLWSFM